MADFLGLMKQAAQMQAKMQDMQAETLSAPDAGLPPAEEEGFGDNWVRDDGND